VTKELEVFSRRDKKTARPCVEHRGCRLARKSSTILQSHYLLIIPRIDLPNATASTAVPTGTAKQRAYPEPSPATEAKAVPFAHWLHKGESHSNEAADLKKLCASFLSFIK
jgi:hypothetical protein